MIGCMEQRVSIRPIHHNRTYCTFCHSVITGIAESQTHTSALEIGLENILRGIWAEKSSATFLFSHFWSVISATGRRRHHHNNNNKYYSLVH